MNNQESYNRVDSADDKIRTKLKFIKSDRDGSLISFISQNPVSGVVCGVRQNSPYPKKVVLVDRGREAEILPNVLYDCVLTPMAKVPNQTTGDLYIPGYIAVEFTPVQFKAVVAVSYTKGSKYIVTVSFGNKTVEFNPYNGRQETRRSFPACRKVLEKRCDVRDLPQVLADFDEAATNLLSVMKRDMREINGQRNYRKAN